MRRKILSSNKSLSVVSPSKHEGSIATQLNKMLKHYAYFEDLSSKRNISIIQTILIVVILSVVGLGAAYGAQFFLSTSNSLFFPLIAVGLAAWYRGKLGGLWSTLICSIGIAVFLLLPFPPSFSVKMTSFIALGMFVIEGVVISLLSERFQHAKELQNLRKKEKDFTEIIVLQQKAYNKARADIQSRDEFLSIASHELKTPLTSMLLKLQIALRNIRTVSLANFSVENLMSMLESAEQQTLRLSKMINDLLNVSLLTTGRVALELEEVDLAEVVNAVVERFSEKLKQEGYILKKELETGIVSKWDRIRLEQIISNLISNAIKYGNHKLITITLKKENNVVKLTIEDRGIGVADKDKKRIFSLFERSVDAKTYKGLGVGLYITNQLVKAHKGVLKVESKLGHGSKFIITLPFLPSSKEKKK